MANSTLVESTTKLEFKITTDATRILATNEKLRLYYWNKLEKVNLGVLFNANGVAVRLCFGDSYSELHVLAPNNDIIMWLYLKPSLF